MLAAACSHFLEPSQVTGNSGPNGTLIVRIGGEERTLVPGEGELAELVYQLTISRSNTIAFSGTFVSPAEYNLEPGNWTLMAEAYSGDNLVATVTKEVNIVAGQTTQTRLTLLPAYTADAAGTFNYTISYPASEDPTNAIGYTNATLILRPLDQQNSGSVLIDLLADKEGTLDLPPGCYIMTINITSTRQIEGNPLSVNRVEAVYIYPRLATEAVFVFASADFIAYVRLAGTAVVYNFDGMSENTGFTPVRVSAFDDNNHFIEEGAITPNNSQYEWELFVPSFRLSRGNLDSVYFSFTAASNDNPERTIDSFWQSGAVYYPHGNPSVSLSMRTKAADIGSELPGTGGSIDFSSDVVIDDRLDFTISNPVNYGLIADTVRVNSPSVSVQPNITSENGKIYVDLIPPPGVLRVYANFFHLKGTALFNIENPFGFVPVTIEAFEPGEEGEILIASAPVTGAYNNYTWEIPISADYVWRSASKKCRLLITLQADELETVWEAFVNIDELTADTDIVPPISINNLIEGTLLILQAFGTGGGAQNGVNRSFVELYNGTNQAIDLGEYSLYFANGTRGLPKATQDGPWSKINLSGSIPALGSYLILGPDNGGASTRYTIAAGYGDINNNSFILGNRSFKVALVKSTTVLTDAIQNPFDIDGNGAKVAGYIDMVGAANDISNATNPDQILGFETAPSRNSGSEAVRRKNLIDTNNNSTDFIAARYASGGLTDEEVEARRPRNSSDGAWNPFTAPLPPPAGTEMLMILQANNRGNDNGGFPKSLVELYNNTNVAINLDTGNYYLHIGSNGTPGWTHAIKLTGTVPARSSYLVVTNNSGDFNPDIGAQTHNPPIPSLPVADQEADFVIANTNFKVAVFKNQSAILTIANPFGDASLSLDYVDMLGAGNATGFETATATSSRPQIARRTSLTDTNNNSNDFGQYDTRSANWATNEPNISKYWPRNSDAGPWNPITGEDM
jgi:hypothetical protein